jgi:hypothetical protein
MHKEIHTGLFFISLPYTPGGSTRQQYRFEAPTKAKSRIRQLADTGRQPAVNRYRHYCQMAAASCLIE